VLINDFALYNISKYTNYTQMVTAECNWSLALAKKYSKS